MKVLYVWCTCQDSCDAVINAVPTIPAGIVDGHDVLLVSYEFAIELDQMGISYRVGEITLDM